MSSTLKKGYSEYIIKYSYTMYIYKTTNNINNKVYIGLSSKVAEKSKFYYGSGTLIWKAIKNMAKKTSVKKS